MYRVFLNLQKFLRLQFFLRIFRLPALYQKQNLHVRSCLYRVLLPKWNFQYCAVSPKNLSISYYLFDANQCLVHLKYTKHLPIANQFVLPGEFFVLRRRTGIWMFCLKSDNLIRHLVKTESWFEFPLEFPKQ